jgi:hypothetical protein
MANTTLTIGKVRKGGWASTFELKFPRGRSAQEFVIYPAKEKDEVITVQSGKRIGVLNLETGILVITKSLNRHPSFIELQLATVRHEHEEYLISNTKDLEPILNRKGYATTGGAI